VAEIEIFDWGLIDYSQALERQRAIHQELIQEKRGDCLVVCQHPHVITKGRSTPPQSLLSNSNELEQSGISVFEVERGGDITFHGPGQLVAYPLLNLKHYKTDVSWYMRQLEESIIRTLTKFNIKSIRNPGKTGVWINENTKIASLGVKISRWCCMHGISLNVTKESEAGFKHIVPCGLANVSVTSIESITGLEQPFSSYQTAFIDSFLEVFKD
jgi:lipoyl(octanoyl) transferase